MFANSNFGFDFKIANSKETFNLFQTLQETPNFIQSLTGIFRLLALKAPEQFSYHHAIVLVVGTFRSSAGER